MKHLKILILILLVILISNNLCAQNYFNRTANGLTTLRSWNFYPYSDKVELLGLSNKMWRAAYIDTLYTNYYPLLTVAKVSDVTITSLQDKDLFFYNTASGKWENGSAGFLGISLTSHNHSGVYEPVFSKNSGFNLSLGSTAGTVSEGNHAHSGVYEPVFSKNTGFNKNFGTGATEVAYGNHTHSGLYEPVFSKNTGFNKNFGTGATEVAYGNHTHSGVYEPVFNKNDAFNKTFATKAQAEEGTDSITVMSPKRVKEAINYLTTPSSSSATYIIKTADESVASSTAFQSDDQLTFAVENGGAYIVEYKLFTEGSTSGDIALYPFLEDVTSIIYGGAGLSNGATLVIGELRALAYTSLTNSLGYGTITGYTTTISGWVYFVNDSDTDTFEIKWAQISSNATATTVKAGSYLTYKKVN